MSMQFIRSVIHVAHVDFSAYDIKNHGLIYSSGLAAEMLGYSEEEMYEFSRNYNDEIIHPGDHDMMHEKLQQLLDSPPGQIIEAIARYKKKTGEYIWGYTRKMVSERDENGEPLKITTVAQDVTDLVTMKKELDSHVAQLERISHVNAHELRGPVASILGLTNLMTTEGMIGEYNREILHHLNRTVVKLDDVVRELVRGQQHENGDN